MLKDTIKNKLMEQFVPVIQSFDAKDIYAISFFVYDYDDHPCKPTVTLGYNTEEEVKKNLRYLDEPEARWNYACWIQNQESIFGYDADTMALLKEWILENNFLYMEHYNPYDTTTELTHEMEKITKAFVEILIETVKEIHNKGIIREKFGRDIPILIHELEYYDEIGEQNRRANGVELVKDFSDYINSLYDITLLYP